MVRALATRIAASATPITHSVTPHPNERIGALYRAALALPENERARFVAERAGADEVLRGEVERLLAKDRTEAGDSSATDTLRPGARLGAYVIESRLGSGGMGEVFRAVDTRLGRNVAIKLCSARVGERFEREARALSALNHPHVCTLFDVGSNYLVMELIDGETLAARIERGALSVDEAARVGAEIAEALAEAHHAHIVHRDLKPQNVMLTRHGVKVLDFGIAKLVTEDALTRTGTIIGTAAYLAPEQLAGEDATPRSDLYALGVLLHEAITRRRPSAGKASARMASRLPRNDAPVARGVAGARAAALEAVVSSLLELDPMRRPASAAVVAERLHALASAPRTRRWARVGGLAAVVALSFAAAGSWWLMRLREESAPLEVVRLAPFTTLGGAKRDAAFSPDGRALAFV